jgi:leucyl/phenylalanyl-tRNA--protein transferase
LNAPRLYWIDPSSPPDTFPPADEALTEPDGLLAVGGDLSPERLLLAYTRGIFPWYTEGQPILWWSPDPRCVLRPDRFHVSRRFQRELRRSTCDVSFNAAFDAVIDRCAAPRPHQQGTWITSAMRAAYLRLHELGWAHSVEVWSGEQLVGGVYGLAIDRVFFGESMFSDASNGSKTALFALCNTLERRNFALLDCQVESPHLFTLGAETMRRPAFEDALAHACGRRIPLTGLAKARFPVRSLTESTGRRLQ